MSLRDLEQAWTGVAAIVVLFLALAAIFGTAFIYAVLNLYME